MSAFLSIRKVAVSVAGRVASYFIRDRFDNEALITQVTCPTLLIHGRLDELIPYEHSYALFKLCGGPASFMLS